MRSRSRRLVSAVALTALALVAMAAGGWFAPLAAEATASQNTPSLTATVNWDKSVDLTLTDGPTDWWFKINWWGTCTAVTGTAINGIQGYSLGTHSVWAYSDSSCNTQIAATTFTIPAAIASLAATVNSDRSVDLTLSNGPSNWYFRIGNSNGWGTCTAVSGTTVSGIRGYAPGSYGVGAFATAGCTDFLADADFTIPDPPAPTATLATTVNPGPSVDLTLTDGPGNWWFRINWWGHLHACDRYHLHRHRRLPAGRTLRRCLFRQRLHYQDRVVVLRHSRTGPVDRGRQQRPLGRPHAQRRAEQLVVQDRLVGNLHGGDGNDRQQHPGLPVGIVRPSRSIRPPAAPPATTSRRSRSPFPPQP